VNSVNKSVARGKISAKTYNLFFELKRKVKWWERPKMLYFWQIISLLFPEGD